MPPLAIEDGVRESTQNWREVLLNLKSRGLNVPKLAIKVMAPWGSGRPWMKYMARHASSAEPSEGEERAAFDMAGTDKDKS